VLDRPAGAGTGEADDAADDAGPDDVGAAGAAGPGPWPADPEHAAAPAVTAAASSATAKPRRCGDIGPCYGADAAAWRIGLVGGHDLTLTPSSIRPFDAAALYQALDARLISPSTLTGMARNPRTSCQHALFMLRWLGRPAADFVYPARW